jgi:glycosyltransferase involved in cell wall biosynthesis
MSIVDATDRFASDDLPVYNPVMGLVHEWLSSMAGSEKVLAALHELYPTAPIMTACADSKVVAENLPNAQIRTSFLQKLPLVSKCHQKLLPLYMIAFEQFDMSDFDLVISSSHCAAKAVITRPDACHICYCHSPMRYAWDLYSEYRKSQGRLARGVWALVSNYVRMWDLATASRVDYFIANSTYISRRIQKFYGKPSVVIHPPVDIDRFDISRSTDNYYLSVARFAPYKRIDMVIRAFNKLGWNLVVIGYGEQEEYLKRIAGPTIQFKGEVSDESVAEYFAHCKASIHAAQEDFGINMVESLAAGRPVVAFGTGGASDIIDPGVNGVLFYEPTVDSLVSAIRKSASISWDPELIKQTSLRFSKERFKEELSAFVEWAQCDFRDCAHGTLQNRGSSLSHWRSGAADGALVNPSRKRR